MNLYLSKGRIWTGTQADAKEAQGGKDFIGVDFPTDKPGLLDTLNRMPELFPNMFTGMDGLVGTITEDEATDFAERIGLTGNVTDGLNYQNGMPTKPYLKSRDPSALSTCLGCGRDDRAAQARNLAATLADVRSFRNPDDLAAIIAAAQGQKDLMESE